MATFENSKGNSNNNSNTTRMRNCPGTAALDDALGSMAARIVDLPRIASCGRRDEDHCQSKRRDNVDELFSFMGIHRRKHTLRFVFRSASFAALICGYALYRGVSSASSSLTTGLRLANGTAAAVAVDINEGGRPHEQSRPKFEVADDGRGDGDGDGEGAPVTRRRLLEDVVFQNTDLPNNDDSRRRTLQDDNETGSGALANSETDPAALLDEQDVECPSLEKADPTWLAVFYFLGVLYLFLALAIVCDEFFVPALEEMSSEHHLNLSMDVAGATLMAAGGSAPELFTSFVGTFQESDIGIGTIVGSAVFNVLFVIGMCSVCSKEVLTLTWWPLFRDSAYYAVGLVVLSLLVGVFTEAKVLWWEALILLGMYVGYVVLMSYNRRLYTMLTGKVLVLTGEEEDNDEVGGQSSENQTTDVAEAEGRSSEEYVENGEDADGNGTNTSGNGTGGHVNGTDAAITRGDSKRHELSTVINTKPTNRADFRWPGTFRAGVLKLLLHPADWADRGGIGIVAKIQGDVDHVFKQIDTNGDGSIDKEELGNLFVKLGHEISQEDLDQVFQGLDLDSNGEISDEEFAKWYVRSEERILSEVKPIFDKFDADQSGTITRDEVRALLESLDPHVTESDVDDGLKAMYKSGSTEEITYEEFADWYVHSIIYTRQQQQIEKKIEEEAQGVCEALKPPFGDGCLSWARYLLVLPLVACLTFTIPDVRRPGLGKWCYVSFVLSIIWIGLFSYFMVGWAEILGNTIGIPSVVMGLTFLAAGTSVPDLLSSVIVARMGEGDMAVSSSIGSNIFDILVGLPLPWLIFTIWPSTPDVVTISAKGIWVSIFILLGMLVAIILIIHCQGWKMTRTVGAMMFILYFCFLAQAVVVEYYRDPCFG
mmetsp:Transcript_30479/g.63534  ORF Transcript_30479/g.63534 Transcript_30479/m.63534 type:complete len:880 (+) Transcript_30479:231-2870(+)